LRLGLAPHASACLAETERAKLYVHGAGQPPLVVNELKLGRAEVAIGLWMGPETVAHFASLTITPQRRSLL